MIEGKFRRGLKVKHTPPVYPQDLLFVAPTNNYDSEKENSFKLLALSGGKDTVNVQNT